MQHDLVYVRKFRINLSTADTKHGISPGTSSTTSVVPTGGFHSKHIQGLAEVDKKNGGLTARQKRVSLFHLTTINTCITLLYGKTLHIIIFICCDVIQNQQKKAPKLNTAVKNKTGKPETQAGHLQANQLSVKEGGLYLPFSFIKFTLAL